MTKIHNRRSALRARASVMAMMTGLALMVQQQKAMAQFTINPAYNATSCVLNINSTTVPAGGFGRSIFVQSDAFLGDNAHPGLTVDGSTLSGSFVNDGNVTFGPPGCSNSGTGSILTVSGGPAAAEFKNSTIIGGVFNNGQIDSTQNGIAFEGSTLGVSSNASTVVVFENTSSITAGLHAVSMTSGSVYGTINNALSLIEGGEGAGIRLVNMNVSGGLENSATIKSLDAAAIVIDDTTIGARIFNDATGKIVGNANAGAGVSFLGTVTVTQGLQNRGEISGYNGVEFDADSFSGGIVNTGTRVGPAIIGQIKGGYSGIAGNVETFSGGIRNEDDGVIEGESGYGIYLEGGAVALGIEGPEIVPLASSSSFTGQIFNNFNARISGDRGGIFLDFDTINSEFQNQGLIEMTGTNSSSGPLGLTGGAAAWFNAAFSHEGSYTNDSGRIDGTSRSGGSGLVITGGAVNADVLNTLDAVIIGSSQSGGTGLLIGASSMTGNVTNEGNVTGDIGIAIGPNFFGIETLALEGIDFTGNLTNSGSVNGNTRGISVYADEWNGNFVQDGSVTKGVELSANTWNGDLTTGVDSIISNSSGSGLRIGSGLFEVGSLDLSSELEWVGNVIHNGTTTGAESGAIVALDSFSGSFVNNGIFSGSGDTGLAIYANTWTGDWTNALGATMSGGATGALINVGQFSGNATNNGLIQGGGVDTGWHIVANTYTGDITNSGTLVAPGNAWHIDVATMSGSIANNGTVDGGANVAINDWSGNFTNALGAQITNLNGDGLRIGASTQSASALEGFAGVQIWTGDFDNDGLISAINGNGASIAVDTFSGSFTNAGTLSGAAESMSATGLHIQTTTWNGDFTNAAGATISGSETGFFFQGDEVTGTFTNNGTISGGALTTGWHFVANNHTGNLANGATGLLEAPSLAWHLEINNLDGDVINDGTVNATAFGGVAALLKSNGGSGSYAGQVLNNGTISADTSSGTGLRIETFVENGVVNTGTLKGQIAYDTTDAAGATAFAQNGANSLVEGEMRLSLSYADAVTFEGGALKGSIYGSGDDDDVTVDVGSGNAFAFNDNVVTGINAFTAKSGTTLLGSLAAGTDGSGMTMDSRSVTVQNGAELYLDDNVVVNTDGLDIESGATLTYFLTTNVGQHGVINVTAPAIPAAIDNFSILAAPGVANVDGTIQAYLSDYDAFRTSGQSSFLYTGVIDAAGGVNGTFDVAAFAGLVPLGFQYTVSAVNNPNSVDLLLTRAAFNDLIEDPTNNQDGVGDALEESCDNATEGSPLADFCNYVGLLDESEIPDAYDDVSGFQHSQLAGVGLDLAELLTLPTNENSAHGSAFGTCRQAGFGWCGTQQYAALASPTQATDAMPDEDPFAWLRPGKREVGRTGIWGRYVGNWRNVEGDQNASGMRAHTDGFGGGIDHVVSNDLLIGVAGLFAETTSKFSGRPEDKGDITTYQAGAYASWGDANLYLNANATLIWNAFETRRRIQIGPDFVFADGDFDGMGASAFLEMGTVIESDGFRFQPQASLFYMTHTTDAFTETGAAELNLIVSEGTTDSLRSQIGGRLAYPFRLDGRRIVPEVRAAWRHEFLDVRQDTTVRFDLIGSPDTTIRGSSHGRDMAVLGAGVSASLGGSTVLYGDVDGAFSADKTSVQGSIGLRHSW